MTLDEAIRHAGEVAEYDCYNDEQKKCADEHRQLAEWLRELKRLRESATDADTISRQAALDALGEAPEVWMDTPEEFAELNQWEYDVAAIKAVPSADRPIGEWIDNGDRYYRCSLCGTRDTDTWDWCHGCGCRMKGVDDDRQRAVRTD